MFTSTVDIIYVESALPPLGYGDRFRTENCVFKHAMSVVKSEEGVYAKTHGCVESTVD